MQDFYVFLTFDIDQDFNVGSDDDYYNKSTPVFKGMEEGLPLIMDKVGDLPFSVFLRSDYQIQQIYGKYDYLIDRYYHIVDEVTKSNGEINWHIHTYKQAVRRWLQITDENELVARFLADYETVKHISQINSNIVRIGECVMNNSLMAAMGKAGISMDSSALPGRGRFDKDKYFDWRTTTNQIYCPSITDYRSPGGQHHNIIEVPMTTIFMKADYDDTPLLRYFNLAFRTEILFQNMDNYIRQNNFLVAITHPFEILNQGATHKLVGYEIDIFHQNLQKLIYQIKSTGKRPVFKKMSDLLHEEHLKRILS